MEKMFTISLSEEHLNVVYRALLELPAKFSVPVMDEIKKQFDATIAEMNKEEKKETKK